MLAFVSFVRKAVDRGFRANECKFPIVLKITAIQGRNDKFAAPSTGGGGGGFQTGKTTPLLLLRKPVPLESAPASAQVSLTTA